MARAHQDLASDADVAFVHAARTPADIIFRQELSLMARERPGFRPIVVCETDAPDERWSGFMGRLSLPMLSLIAPDLLEREIYACGPSRYMAAIRAMLAQAGFDMGRYHQESFDFAEMTGEQPAIEQAIAPLEAQRFGVEFNRSRRSIDCGADTFVLDAARAAGMRLPSSCTRGMCGTCKSKLVSGKVTMTHAGGIRQREIDQGMILICCSKPASDLVIER